MAESLVRGSRVIVSGRLKQRSFETREGEKRTVVELEVDEIGPSLKYATGEGEQGQPQRRRGRRFSAEAAAVSPAAPSSPRTIRGAAPPRRDRSAAPKKNPPYDTTSLKQGRDCHGEGQ